MKHDTKSNKDSAKRGLQINIEKLRELTPEQSEGVVGGWSCKNSCKQGGTRQDEN